MGFGNFKTDSEVADIFNLTIEERFFIESLHFDIPEYEMKQIKKLLDDPLSFLSQEAICEDIIKSILRLLDTAYEELHVWSHVPYNVDQAKNLSGIPDFLVARPKRVKSIMDVPPLCIIEAKRQNWDEADQLQRLFNTLNWVFNEANQVIIEHVSN